MFVLFFQFLRWSFFRLVSPRNCLGTFFGWFRPPPPFVFKIICLPSVFAYLAYLVLFFFPFVSFPVVTTGTLPGTLFLPFFQFLTSFCPLLWFSVPPKATLSHCSFAFFSFFLIFLLFSSFHRTGAGPALRFFKRLPPSFLFGTLAGFLFGRLSKRLRTGPFHFFFIHLFGPIFLRDTRQTRSPLFQRHPPLPPLLRRRLFLLSSFSCTTDGGRCVIPPG